MDSLSSFSKKSLLLGQEKLGPIVKKLQKTIHSTLLKDTDPRSMSPALVRSAAFELSYLLIRHRQWHCTNLLPELAIDFLSSEYLIPVSLSSQLVEAAIDVLHSFTPRELDWTADDYEREFLEHLIVCSLLSSDEESLEIDLGVGKNVLSLLKNALALDQESSAFHFVPEITQHLHGIMQNLFADLEAHPEAMDLYRLKNMLQRDSATAKNRLTRPYLLHLNAILTACWPNGCHAPDLPSPEIPGEIRTDLRLLTRTGLIYEEPKVKGRRGEKGPLFRLSNKGYELTCMRFAYNHWQELGTALHLKDLPPPYQATAIQLLAKESPFRLQALVEIEGNYLSPLALRFVIDGMKRNSGEKGLLEIFTNLLHNQAHAWIRAEICGALPLANGESIEGELLDALLNEDPSPMVRSAARAVLQRQRSKVPSPQSADL